MSFGYDCPIFIPTRSKSIVRRHLKIVQIRCQKLVQEGGGQKVGGADKKLDFLSDPIIPSELQRT